MYKNEKKASDLARLLQPYSYVLVDTCSLMDEDFPEWMDVLEGAKKYCKPKVPVYLLKQCEDELHKHSRDSGDIDKRIAAQRALHILGRHWLNKPIKILKEKNENFADNAIYVKVSTDRLHAKILVVTQDRKLATDLLNLNELASQRGYRVAVYKIIDNGELVPNRGEAHRPMSRGEDRRLSSKAPAPHNHSGGIPEVKTPNSIVDAIRRGDARLRANLANFNYAAVKKIKDIDAQIELLGSAPESALAEAKLTYGVAALVIERAKLTSPVAEEAPKPQAKEAPQPQTEAPAPTKVEKPKLPPAPEAEKPAEAPKGNPAQAKRSWYGFGHGLDYAFEQVALHYGIMFRDAAVPYFAAVHGPIDVTIADKKTILEELTSALEKEESVTLAKKGYRLKAEKGRGGFRIYLLTEQENVEKAPTSPAPAIEKAPAPEAKAETKPAPQPQAEAPAPSVKPAGENAALPPAPKTRRRRAAKPASTADKATPAIDKAPAPKAEAPVAEAPAPQTLLVQRERDSVKAANVKANAPRKPSRGKKASQEASAPARSEDVGTAAPQGATLVAMIPGEEMKDRIERSARFDSLKAPKEAAKQGASSAPAAKRKAAPKAPAKKAAAPAEAKKEAQPEKKAAAPKRKPAAKKPAKAAAVPAVDSEALAKADKVLRANLANPNYKVENKAKDVKKMLELLKQATPEQKKALHFGEDKLRQALNDLK